MVYFIWFLSGLPYVQSWWTYASWLRINLLQISVYSSHLFVFKSCCLSFCPSVLKVLYVFWLVEPYWIYDLQICMLFYAFFLFFPISYLCGACMCRSEVNVGNYPPSVFYLIHESGTFNQTQSLRYSFSCKIAYTWEPYLHLLRLEL